MRQIVLDRIAVPDFYASVRLDERGGPVVIDRPDRCCCFCIHIFSETSELVSGAFLGRQRMKAARVDPRVVFPEIPPE